MQAGDPLARLAAQAAEGDEAARAELIDRSAPLINSMAVRMAGRVPAEELRQAGVVGLLEATGGFDPGRGTPFIAYARPFVAGEMLASIRDAAPVRIPRPVRETAQEVDRAVDELTARDGRPPTLAQIADYSGLDLDRVVDALYARMVGAESGGPLLDTDMLAEPDEELAAVETRIVLRDLISDLDERSRRVVGLRFGAGLSQREIAARMGVSQMQVSRILRGALGQLRDDADEGSLMREGGTRT